MDILQFVPGAVQTPPSIMSKAWGIELAVQPRAPRYGKFHSPLCNAAKMPVNQNGYGACVTFSGDYVHGGQEKVDEGKWLYYILDALHAYAEIKGLQWPIPDVPVSQWDPSPGLWPPQLWDYLIRTGWPTTDGSLRRKIGSYYNLGKPSSSSTFIDAFAATVEELGPVQFTAEWDDNWWGTDSHGFMPTPSGRSVGGHAFGGCGYNVEASRPYAIHAQSWGNGWGADPEYPNHFRVYFDIHDRVGWECWKATDIRGDGPVPPEEPMLPIVDFRHPKIVKIPIGTQLFKTDGKTILTTLRSGGDAIVSPLAHPDGLRTIIVSSGSVVQQAVVPSSSYGIVGDLVEGVPVGEHNADLDNIIALAQERKR